MTTSPLSANPSQLLFPFPVEIPLRSSARRKYPDWLPSHWSRKLGNKKYGIELRYAAKEVAYLWFLEIAWATFEDYIKREYPEGADFFKCWVDSESNRYFCPLEILSDDVRPVFDEICVLRASRADLARAAIRCAVRLSPKWAKFFIFWWAEGETITLKTKFNFEPEYCDLHSALVAAALDVREPGLATQAAFIWAHFWFDQVPTNCWARWSTLANNFQWLLVAEPKEVGKRWGAFPQWVAAVIEDDVDRRRLL